MFHLERRDGVHVLRMDDGKVNAMGPGFVQGFPQAWRDATADGAPVVLAGNAKVFCAGLDLRALVHLDAKETADFGRAFMRVFRDVLAHPRPVVAAVDGAALAGGAILALAADYRLVSPAARLGLTEVPVGVPFPGPVADLARLFLPVQELPDALLRGAVREGPECVARGWAQALVPRERLVEEAVTMARELGGFSPLAFASAKQHPRTALLAAVDRFDAEAEAWAAQLFAEETKAALAATLARLGKR